jgi:dolichol-phosphate mannosyltransferase
MKLRSFFYLLGLLQILLGLRVLSRLLRTYRGEHIEPIASVGDQEAQCVTVLVPVLNERERLAPCLEGLLKQGAGEILVIDGGSHDGTQDLVEDYARWNSHLRLLDASPIPADWNGKAWGLQVGFQHLAPTTRWLLMLDADVRPEPRLIGSLLAHARKRRLDALSVATRQEIADARQGVLHPSLLTTLVYRFGIPGGVARTIAQVQANGQCLLCRRDVLEQLGGFGVAADSLCEDVTLARALVAAGNHVGFYEADELVFTRMYENWRETWQNWPRSLPLRDRFAHWQALLGLLEVALIQAAPLPLVLLLARYRSRPRWLFWLNHWYILMRIGVLVGTMRAYRQRPWTYWLSPLCDLPVAGKLTISALRRRHTWRGRVIVRGGRT